MRRAVAAQQRQRGGERAARGVGGGTGQRDGADGAAGRQAQHPGRKPVGLSAAPGTERDHEPEQQAQMLEREALLKMM